MGEIKTHKAISQHTISQLKGIDSNANYTWIEFGNFLTDISQFRDPYSYITGKAKLFAGTYLHPVLHPNPPWPSTGKRLKWLDDLFGSAQPHEKRHGALPNFFYYLGQAYANLKFADNSSFALKEKDIEPLPVEGLNREFLRAFTQYYPHEHLDYPPPLFLGIIEPKRLRSYSRLNRGLIGYLEHQIQYISEELTKVEFEWINNRGLPASHPIRCELLVRLGHILHAVEDYYFHSNAVEIRQFKLVSGKFPGRRPIESLEDYQFILSNGLYGIIPNEAPNSILLRRRFARRLRFHNMEKPAIDFVYTGAFGADDVSHTLHDGLKSIEESLSPEQRAGVKKFKSPLLRVLLSEQERHLIAGSNVKTIEYIEEHNLQLRQLNLLNGFDPKIHSPLLEDFELANCLNPQAKAALLKAFEEDIRLLTDYPMLTGVGGFLIFWLGHIQRQVNTSKNKSKELDKDVTSIFNTDIDNGASEERVGSHSLLSKDSDEKEPLRKEAVALAKFASAAVAVTLLDRIKENPNPKQGIDWDIFIRHFLRIPNDEPDSWEEQVLGEKEEMPTLSTILNKPPIKMLTLGDPGKILEKRRAGVMAGYLENLYEQLER